MSSFASLVEGRDTWSAHCRIPRHRHERAYAAIILSECHGLTPATVSRGFARVFETSPAAFRAEARALRAFARITAGGRSLAGIAAVAGFADQAHMTRAIRALTGRPPGHWLRSIRFKTVPKRPFISEP
jgi:AraC-like DNA-binding protein